MQFIGIENKYLALQIATDGSVLRIKSEYGCVEYTDYLSVVYGGSIVLDLLDYAKVRIFRENDVIKIDIKDLIWYARFPAHGYIKPDPSPDIKFSFEIRLEEDEVLFTVCTPQNMDDEPVEIVFPRNILKWDPQKPGELAGAFHSLGSLHRYPSEVFLHINYRTILPVAGFFTSNGGIGIRTSDIYDYKLELLSDGKTGCGNMVFEFNKDKNEYNRTCRMKFFPAGSNYVHLAKWHRNAVQKENRFRSLKEKIACSPEVEKLAGSVIWKHNTYPAKVPDGVKKDYSLYVRSLEAGEAEGKPGNWSAKEIFDTANHAGFDRVCILNTGWNNKGFDSGYPTRFPVNPERGTEDDFKNAAAYGRALSDGYIFSVHDNYRDVYPNSDEFTFDEIMTDRNGGRIMGGIWRGGRCYLECGKCTLKYAERDLPHIAQMCGRGAIYLDVQGCVELKNCYHPDHPGSRSDDAEWRLETFRIAKKHIGAIATEGAPHEFAVQDIDLGAYPPIKAGSDPNMKPIPFFQLVYHDSIYTFCGQGVSGVYGREYINRVALYGMLPWDFSSDSLEISRKMRGTCTAEMISHDFCAEAVEHTVFSDGTEVYANFSDQETLQIAPQSFVITRKLNGKTAKSC